MTSSFRESVLSKTLDTLRFPMCVLVVLIHTNQGMQEVVKHSPLFLSGCKDFGSFNAIANFISVILANVAVPTFFITAGFLFFYSNRLFSLESYWSKIKSRFSSLFIPYLAWNVIFALLYLVAQLTLGTLVSDSHKLLINYNFKEWLSLFWSSPDFWNNPIDQQLWFVRDLMVLMVLSPIVFYFVKFLKAYGVALLIILWIFGFPACISRFEQTACVFFTLGAFLGIKHVDFAEILRPYINYLIAIYVLAVVCVYLFKPYDVFFSLSIIIGIAMFVSIYANIVTKKHVPDIVNSKFLSSSSFFVYAFHGMPVIMFVKLLNKTLHPQSSISFLLIYFGSALLVILTSLFLYYFVRKGQFVRKCLTGNR